MRKGVWGSEKGVMGRGRVKGGNKSWDGEKMTSIRGFGVYQCHYQYMYQYQ
jgi:hypothetical protein